MNAMMYQIDIFTCQGCGTEFESKDSVDGYFHLCPGAVKDSKVCVRVRVLGGCGWWGCGTEYESKDSVDGHFHLCPGALKDNKVCV